MNTNSMPVVLAALLVTFALLMPAPEAANMRKLCCPVVSMFFLFLGEGSPLNSPDNKKVPCVVPMEIHWASQIVTGSFRRTSFMFALRLWTEQIFTSWVAG